MDTKPLMYKNLQYKGENAWTSKCRSSKQWKAGSLWYLYFSLLLINIYVQQTACPEETLQPSSASYTGAQQDNTVALLGAPTPPYCFLLLSSSQGKLSSLRIAFCYIFIYRVVIWPPQPDNHAPTVSLKTCKWHCCHLHLVNGLQSGALWWSGPSGSIPGRDH